MNAQDYTRIVQSAYAAFGRGDIKTILDLLDAKVDWQGVVGVGPNVPTGGLRAGPAQVEQFFSQVNQNVDFKTFEPREFVAERDKVVALGYYEGLVKKTGRTFKSEWAMVFTFSAGRIVRMREYADAHAITAAF
jgi:ketosteroid isomerase-like protein